MFASPSICVGQIVAAFCWSVQRADRERLPYGKTGRRERERAQHTEGGRDKKWQEVVRKEREREQQSVRGESVGSERDRARGYKQEQREHGGRQKRWRPEKEPKTGWWCVSHSRWVRKRVREVGGRAYNLEAEEVTVGGVHCSVMCYDPTHTHTNVFLSLRRTYIRSWRLTLKDKKHSLFSYRQKIPWKDQNHQCSSPLLNTFRLPYPVCGFQPQTHSFPLKTWIIKNE